MIVFYFRRSTFSNMLLTLVRQLLAIHIAFRYIVISVCEESSGMTWTIIEICSSDSKLLIRIRRKLCSDKIAQKLYSLGFSNKT